jgi:hypothetical protein
MSRNFDNFLTAYESFTNNKFIPPQFNTWSALSVIAGALERKVWLPWDDSFAFYPNIYVLLVSLPGDGKSVALNRAVELLREVSRRSGKLHILPNQVTEAKFIELMGHGQSFVENSSGREVVILQNAGYYSASEASNSLRNIFGDFIACLTDFYDCPATWERATKKDGRTIGLRNVCMNILAGSTFDYLSKLVNDENIMGGFASRLIYVVSLNKEVEDQQFQLGGGTAEMRGERRSIKEALIEDLTQISQLVGPMHADREFGAAWEEWYPTFERTRRKIESEKLQSVLARTNTNILKVAMLLSAAESNDRQLKLRHWQKAHELVTAISEKVPGIFRQARANSTDRSPTNIPNIVVNALERGTLTTIDQLCSKLIVLGYPKVQAENTIRALMDSGKIGFGNIVAGQVPRLQILANTDNDF